MPVKTEFTDPADRVREEARKLEPLFQVVFLRAVRVILDDMTLTEIADLLSAGQIDEALRSVERAAGLIGNVFTEGLLSNAATTVTIITPALIGPPAFDPTALPVVTAMRDARLDIITDFSQRQRDAVLEALRIGALRGDNPITTARRFRESIGLTEEMVKAVENYRDALENGNRYALRLALRDKRSDPRLRRLLGKEVLDPEYIDRLVTRYRENMLRFRAERIARTESLAAANNGVAQAYSQMVDVGAILNDELEKTWNTSRDGRERDSHAALDGDVKRGDEPFQGFASQLRFPHDPQAAASERVNCRCALEYRLRPSP